MATVVLAAAGAAIGGAVGGGVLGISSVVLGRAIGATIGRRIDERILGAGAEPVETGRIDRYRIMGAQEGRAIPVVQGRMRIGGQVIWATAYREHITESGGGKNSGPKQRSYSYSVSLAISLCEGRISGIGRIWADGQEIAPKDLTLRLYPGTEDQLPDPLIEAVEGAGTVPAYRGLAYVVIEDLDLSRFGNRVPQFSFEVIRPVAADTVSAATDLAQGLSGVALMPGSGEYALATTPVHVSDGLGRNRSVNVNSPSEQADFPTSVNALRREMPGVRATSLIVSWFGTDLRAGECQVQPRVEQTAQDGVGMPWQVSGLTRAIAGAVPQDSGSPVYGGTPADAAVIEAIQHLNAQGLEVMFYPFILMEQMAGNTLPDPWTGNTGQPALPWRGRITSSLAAGLGGSPDGTQAATDQVAAFFGAASPANFAVSNGQITYSGPQDWGFRRFILHYAMLCQLAGGVESFCIGSELRGLTQIRGPGNSFPAVAQLMALAADVRQILGPDVKISYAADWSEYFGYHPQDGSGDVFFHLDPLWASDDIDFVGIDNYMPLSDWREGDSHRDAHHGAIYALPYLQGNVEGGEGYDWFYHSQDAREAQIRTPITDAHGEPWVWRCKDIRNWWQNAHNNRIGGVRQEMPTDWVPMSKPIRFTEFGCAAIDKGTNQPNRFLDPKSSESGLPAYSNGARDDFLQRQYFAAHLAHWSAPESNPVSPVYGGPMLDMDHAFAWAWDARPYPTFPNNSALWHDAGNYATGHWLNGRSSARALGDVLTEICAAAGVAQVDVSQAYGVVRGYAHDGTDTARAALQPLLLAHGLDVTEREGVLQFRPRAGQVDRVIDPETLAVVAEDTGAELTRLDPGDDPDRIRLGFALANGSFETAWEEASTPDQKTEVVAVSDLPLALTRSESRLLAERWLAEARAGRDRLRLNLPPSAHDLAPGDVLRFGGYLYRIDQIDRAEALTIDAVRIDPEAYRPARIEDEAPPVPTFTAPVPVLPLFLDLPLMWGDEIPHAPHVAVTATPWPGPIGVFTADADGAFTLAQTVSEKATIGVTETSLPAAPMGVVDRGEALQVRLTSGHLTDASWAAILNGANRLAIGSGSTDRWEVLQFARAELIAPDTYLLRDRLRGQFGTNADMPDAWPEGSVVVLLDTAVGQVPLPPASRNMALDYRTGPLTRALDDPSYVAENLAFAGIGLRPLSPCHLRREGDRFHWIRRSRIEGDSWDSLDPPVGEEAESYLVRVLRGPTVLREVTVTTPEWTYDPVAQAADQADTGYTLQIAQISATFGAGAAASLIVPPTI